MAFVSERVVDRQKLRSWMERESRSWGQLVLARRKTLHWTLATVAARADTTPQTVHKVERGEIVPRDDLRLALAMALMTEVGDLFPQPDHATVSKEVAA